MDTTPYPKDPYSKRAFVASFMPDNKKTMGKFRDPHLSIHHKFYFSFALPLTINQNSARKNISVYFPSIDIELEAEIKVKNVWYEDVYYFI